MKAQGYHLYLSSGDNELNPEIDRSTFDDILIRQQPEDKVTLVKKLKAEGRIVCMAGDGLNDAPALKEADVAMSVADNENSFFPACDVLLTANALGNLPSLMRMVKAAKWVIIVSFAFSLVYNAVGLYYAISAQLSPLMAAILMPSSSLSMLLITWLMTALLSSALLKKTAQSAQ
jgi:Cu+-exporting ATPase